MAAPSETPKENSSETPTVTTGPEVTAAPAVSEPVKEEPKPTETKPTVTTGPEVTAAPTQSEPTKPVDSPEVKTPTTAKSEGTTTTAVGSTAQSDSKAGQDGDVNAMDFAGEVQTNNKLPGPDVLRKIEDYTVLDQTGKSVPFKSLYSGRNVPRRVLIIFVRHFFCGNCQEYLRTLSLSITPESLLRLPISTFIAVIGCGDPGLIDSYQAVTNCPFPIYADPTQRLYHELGMVRTLAMGQRPGYINKSIAKSALESIVQGLKQVKTGLVTKAGDSKQVGGEFLFEPLSMTTPVATPQGEEYKPLESAAPVTTSNGAAKNGANGTDTTTAHTSEPNEPSSATEAADGSASDSPPPSGPASVGRQSSESNYKPEEKRITWCHRMRTTRDHAEIPELMEILGLDGEGQPIKDEKRWAKALKSRKGTGLSMASRMSSLRR